MAEVNDSSVPEAGSKASFRRIARDLRQNLPYRNELSRRIMGAVMALPEYAMADAVMFYVGVRDEVQTLTDIALALDSHRKIVVPWCDQDCQLRLFHLTQMADLSPGRFGILEPCAPLRTLQHRQVTMNQIDLAVVPGVAFDRCGGRIGQGKGYFDRLLSDARSDAVLVSPAFECQLFDEVPVSEHDIPVDFVVTEEHVYPGTGRSRSGRPDF